MTGDAFWAGGPATAPGLAGRYKALRDRYRLKPVLVAVLYLLVPLTTFQLILIQYPGLDPTRFRNATMYIVPAGLALVAVAFTQERHPKGSGTRLGLHAAYVSLSLVWMVAIVGGNTVIRSEYESHPFSIDVTPLIAIGALTACLNFAHDGWEYFRFREGAAGPSPAALPAPSDVRAGMALFQDPAGLRPPADAHQRQPGFPARAAGAGPMPLMGDSATVTSWIPDCAQDPLRCRAWAPATEAPPEKSLLLAIEDNPVVLPGPPEPSGRPGDTVVSINIEQEPGPADAPLPAGTKDP